MHIKKGSNVSSIKQSNRALLLNTIKESGGASRTELSKLTGLSKGGITPIINELLEMRLIKETDIINTDSGRKPIQLEINPHGCHSIAIDWTRNSYAVALVDFRGDIVDIIKNDYSGSQSQDAVLRGIENSIANIMGKHSKKKIVGIGAVVPGPLDYKKGVILSPPNFHGWSNISIGSILEKKFNLPVFLDNNANAHALAEKNFGPGKQYNNFISIVVDEGIGAGIIINDAIYKGNIGLGSEVGHITIDMNGPECKCGNIGCLEVYATIPRLLEWVNNQLKSVSDYAASDYEDMNWDQFILKLKSNDALCLIAMQREAQYVGNALVTLTNLFEPQAIIIGSQLAMADKYITKPLKEFVYNKTIAREFYIPEIYTSNLSYASLKGGATIVMDHFISGNLGQYEELIL